MKVLSYLLLLPLLAVAAEPGGKPYMNEIRIERHKPVPMRDGVILYGDVYRPAAEGRYPTLVVRNPYGVQRDGAHESLIKFAQRGYSAVMMDNRGRYESGGNWDPFRFEGQDGYDAIEWAAKQNFSNGKVGTQGGSYLGHVQWAAASQQPPSLVAMFPSLASTNIFANWITQGGAFRLSFNYGWGVVRMPNRIMLPQYIHTEGFAPEELKYENILMHLPLNALALNDQFEEELRFFDYNLKGIQNGLDKNLPVKLFYMGVNKWRTEADWPIPNTNYRELYLGGSSPANSIRGGGSLSFTKAAASGTHQYRYDPMNPVATLGGNNCCGTPTLAGPKDQRPIEKRDDVLVYTSDFLKDPLTIAGPVKMKLTAATDGPDTDWMVKLVDVYPNGFAMPVAEGILRARYRNGLDKPELLTANSVYDFTVDMVGTANTFQAGHRIRIDITSSNFPQFDRNPNTGEPLGSATKTRVASQTIHHGGPRPSHIVLPVVSNP